MNRAVIGMPAAGGQPGAGRSSRSAAGRRLPAAALLALAFTATPVPAAPPPVAATVISEDTLWQGEVETAGEVRVEKGATLLVAPGTTVRFGQGKGSGEDDVPGSLVVVGTLVAQGTAAEPITFTSAAAEPGAGDWRGIVFDHSSERASRLRHCRIEYAAEGIQGGYSVILLETVAIESNRIGLTARRGLKGGALDCDVSGNEGGIVLNQNEGFQIAASRIAGNRDFGVLCLSGSSPLIKDCEITANGPRGIACVQGSSPLVEANSISGHERGVHVELQSRPLIRRNDITENGTGIWAEKLVFPRIFENTIARNGVGIYCNYSGYPEIHGNNIVDNERFGIVLGDNQSIHVEKLIPFRTMGQFYETSPERSEFLPPQTRKYAPFTAGDRGLVDARGNWWGEETAGEMAEAGGEGDVSVIEDVHDKPDTFYQDRPYPRDRVAFAPWEESPLGGAGRPERSSSGIRGKVVLGGEPAAGVLVHAYRSADGDFRDEGFEYAPTDRDGAYSLALSPGTYFLVAKRPAPPFPHREPETGGLFGYYGGNPVTVGEGAFTESNVQVVARRAVGREASTGGESAVLRGTILGPDGPVEGASLLLYTDGARSFRGPGLFGPQGAVAGGTGPDGGFEVELPAGTYYLVASRRRDGGLLGPLRAGDLHGYFDGNPLSLEKGETATVAVQVVEKLRESASPGGAAGPGGIRGVVSDPSGGTPPGVYAYATTDPNLLIGAMPPYRSPPVGEDGSYHIDLPGGRTYYVGARSGYGGPPLPGEWHGIHGGESPRPVPVGGEGYIEGVDITVRKME